MGIVDLLQHPLFLIALPIIAFLYASVGHGGASGYIALMGIFAFPVTFSKPTALLLNILVSLIAFYHYYKGGYFRWKLFYPFAISSIPFAFIGGYIKIESALYKVFLGVFLVLAILSILRVFKKKSTLEPRSLNIYGALFIGACIGLVSGMIGIGGGIVLSPLLLYLAWADLKETAAVSALFIFVNSISALLGLFVKGTEVNASAFVLVFIAFVGGFLGSYLGTKKFDSKTMRIALSLVLVIALVKLFVS
jgi:uncharacterized protein